VAEHSKRRTLSLIVSFAAIVSASTAIAQGYSLRNVRAQGTPAFNWTGLYLGGHVGAGWGFGPDTVSISASGGNDPVTLRHGTTNDVSYGGHLGYNWQLSKNWLVGLEGDFSLFANSTTEVKQQIMLGGVPTPGATFHARNEQEWLTSARGRLGYIDGRWMLYVTAGEAWIRNRNLGYPDVPLGADCANTCTTRKRQFTDRGLAVGGGLEYAMSSDIIIRTEYLQYGVGAIHAVSANCPNGGCAPFPGQPNIYTWKTDDIREVRAALSVKF
jgi:outer membrane immunogenic protein